MNNRIEINGKVKFGQPKIATIETQNFSKAPMKFAPTDLMPFYSNYLQGGYKEDVLELEFVEVLGQSITGYLSVKECFIPGDGQFHLTVPLVFVWIAQLGIIHGCIENELPRKEGEIYLREIQIKCRRPVNKTKGIKITLTTTKRKHVPEGIFYYGIIDVDDKAFVGYGSYILPIKTYKSLGEELCLK
jgi:hypothetical protein